jgi:hypothetical protein
VCYVYLLFIIVGSLMGALGTDKTVVATFMIVGIFVSLYAGWWLTRD